MTLDYEEGFTVVEEITKRADKRIETREGNHAWEILPALMRSASALNTSTASLCLFTESDTKRHKTEYS